MTDTKELAITWHICETCGLFASHTLSLGDDLIWDYCYPHMLERLYEIQKEWRFYDKVERDSAK